jgi:hypothetical protein
MFDLPNYMFVIDTEQYSGSFERPMTAYCTGVLGECGVGEKEAKKFRAEMRGNEIAADIEEIVQQVPDEKGCCRPCQIWETPGWFNNGLGGHYRDGDAEAEKKALIDHGKFIDKEIEELRRITHWSQEAVDQCVEQKESKRTNVLRKYPSYQSVAINFQEKPSKAMINIFKKRAKRWAQNNEITITGFRLITIEMKLSEEQL